ncbi:lipopolysaccharide-induced tumor necrosis factor-alpha factor homolog [Lutzomyia longipalpis]|uniref:Putative membrane-associated motif in lps-induced tumor necrosis factor alpha factor n=1 Tax=Lutzomyia longipalpis TaxID=7200 RepID=A0A1B0CVX8_LUTLO|nr:lipopolysaccharide-induced tumor necrosis factor-alpha factor homolog [Lutzomyia longipalpis]XP_055686904.1 lipopolysaccharide-induced tumor necrosis factor-alpha factor homolog [Lutzomyia longipalpis]
MEPQKSAYPHQGSGQEYTGNYPHPQPPPAYDQTQYGAPYPPTGAPNATSMPHPQTTQPQVIHTIVNNPPVGPDPSTIVCPSCRQQVITRLDYETTTKTHIMAAILCAFVCWPCAWIPYVMDSCKNANHYCPSCGAFIGTYKS